MIPFDSWDGKNDLSGVVEQAKLEQYFGTAAVAFGTYQAALSSIFEVLGSRTGLIPVIMPITASPDTLAATLRAGGDPILLDIRPQTLQLDPVMLGEVLAEVKAAVVILTRPGGQPVDPDLLAVIGENPTILDSRLPPHNEINKDCICTFNIFDLGPVVGTGAIVVHKYEDQVREIKLIRNGLLGLAGNLNDVLAAAALKRLQSDPGLANRGAIQGMVASRYIDLLKETHAFPFDNSPEWPYFIVRVDNADRVVAHLYSTVEVVKPVFPLHLLSDINRRWTEKPSYPVAEALSRKLIALPTHSGILDKESTIVQLLSEVSNG